MSRAKLHAVEPSTELPVDITLALRSEIMSRDWDEAMRWGDRQKPLSLGERVKRMWRA